MSDVIFTPRAWQSDNGMYEITFIFALPNKIDEKPNPKYLAQRHGGANKFCHTFLEARAWCQKQEKKLQKELKPQEEVNE